MRCLQVRALRRQDPAAAAEPLGPRAAQREGRGGAGQAAAAELQSGSPGIGLVQLLRTGESQSIGKVN